jgi:hypothetical protein
MARTQTATELLPGLIDPILAAAELPEANADFDRWLWAAAPLAIKPSRRRYGTSKAAQERRRLREFNKWLWTGDGAELPNS